MTREDPADGTIRQIQNGSARSQSQCRFFSRRAVARVIEPSVLEAARSPAQQAILVVAAHTARADLLEQIEHARGIGAAHDEIAHHDHAIAERVADGSRIAELVAASWTSPMRIVRGM